MNAISIVKIISFFPPMFVYTHTHMYTSFVSPKLKIKKDPAEQSYLFLQTQKIMEHCESLSLYVSERVSKTSVTFYFFYFIS